MTWEPCGHRPPLPRIETAPRYTPAPEDPIPPKIRHDLERLQRWAQIIEGRRIWQHVVDIAKGA